MTPVKKSKMYTFSVLFTLLLFVVLSPKTVFAGSLQDLLNTGVLTQQDIVDFVTGTNVQQPETLISIDVAGESVAASSTIQIIFLFTLIALAPTLILMMTTFTRTIIVMHFLRSALGTQQMPPNQILIGLALFLTFFVMGPIFNRVNEEAFQPYSAGIITQAEALEIGIQPFREFMLDNVRFDDLALFAGIAGESYEHPDLIPMRVLMPAFILSELTLGFVFGFFLFIPFIVIDMVVASVLMAMGMMMLPPAMISTPFKIMLFILVDGWGFIIELLLDTFVF